MADQQHQSVLSIVLNDDTSGPAKAMGEALLRAASQAKQLDEVLAKSGTSLKFQDNLRRIGATIPQVEGATKALRALADAEGIAADKSGWTGNQAKQFKNLENVTLATVRAQMRATKEAADAQERDTKATVAAAARAAEEMERQKRSETEYVIKEMRRRAQERARLADQEEREARRAADTEAREAKRAADAAVREAEREAREIARIREQEVAAARREHERAVEMQHRMGFGHYVAQGVAAGVSAHGIVSGAERAVEAGSELQNARIGLTQAGITPQVAAQIEQNALSLSSRYANVSQTSIMELSKEARSVLQDPNEIGPVVEALTKAKSVLDASDQSGKSSEGLGALVKGAESIGAAKDPERFKSLLDAYVRAMQVMGTTINPEQIAEFDRYAKTAGARMSDRFLMTTGLSLAQEMGGSTAGNDIAQVQRAIQSGFANRHTALREMVRVGMVGRNDVDFLRNGEAKGLKPGRSIVGADLASTDLDKWVYEDLLPRLEEHGMRTQDAQLDWITRTFTGTQADVISKLITQRSAFENHAKLYPQAAGLDGAENWDSASKGLTAFNTALGNLLGNATSPLMPAAGHALAEMAGALDRVAQVAKDHPAVAGGAAIGLTGAALYGAGRLGMSAINGFGLGASATALDESAAALSASAAELSAAAALKGGVGGVKTAEEIVKDAAKTGGGAAAVGIGAAAAAAIAAGAAVMAGTIYGLQKAVPPKGHLPIADDPHALDPRTKEDAVSATTPSVGISKSDLPPASRTTVPSASDNSAVGQGTGRGFLHKTAYTVGGDDIVGLSSTEAMIARGTQAGFEAAFRNLMATGTTNGMGAGAGLIQASYETDDGVEVSGGGARMARGGRARASLPSLRYGRDQSGNFRFTPEQIDHFTAAGKTFATKSPDLMRRMMKDFKLGSEQAAVIMGNLGHESQGFTAFHEKGLPYEKGGIGWAQWTGSRRREYEAWSQANHLDPKSDEANYGFLKHELMGNPRYKAALDRLRASKGTEADMEAFEKVFEGAGVKAYGSRWAYDRKALQALHDDPTLAGREPQGPRLPERAPRAQGQVTASADPVQIFDHGHLHETDALLDRIASKVARLGHASVSIIHGPRENGRPSQLASRADVGRSARSVASWNAIDERA